MATRRSAREVEMRHLQSIVGILALALGTACGPSIHVNVLASPEANFAGLHTFIAYVMSVNLRYHANHVREKFGQN